MVNDYKLSRALTKLLRHTAPKRNLNLDIHGGVLISDIIKLPEFNKVNINLDTFKRIVKECPKQRFSIYQDLKNNEIAYRICANQAHSFNVIPKNYNIITLNNFNKLKINPNTVVHGTYYSNLNKIKKNGLSRMSRTHIHFGVDIPENGKVISGMRSSCEIVVYINIQKALLDGYEFILSKNRVILCTGNEFGFLPSTYINCIKDRKSGNIV